MELRLLYQTHEPDSLETKYTLWARPVGDNIYFYKYNDGIWQPIGTKGFAFDTPESTAEAIDADLQPEVTLVESGPDTAKKLNFHFKIPKSSSAGSNGKTPILIIGDVTTLLPESKATASVVDTKTVDANNNPIYKLNFGIPSGIKGDTGLKGDKGDKGDKGEQGIKGTDGLSAGFGTPVSSAETIAYNTTPEVTITTEGPDTAKVFNFHFKIPQGKSGSGSGTGTDGKTPVLETGTTTTLDAGSNATVSVTPNGTDSIGNPKYKIDFGIPKGLKGDTGTAGTNGTNGKDAIINVTSLVLGNNDSITGNSTVIACSENIYYKIVAIGNGTITLNTPANSSVYNEYMLEISTTADVTLTFPSTLKWVKAITFTSGKTYQISIVNNIAVWASVTT